MKIRSYIVGIILLLLLLGFGLFEVWPEPESKIVEPERGVEKHQIYTPQKLIEVKWGVATEEFGLISGEEIETIGPLTFTVDENGNIYILDFVKKHIKKFNKEGIYLGNLGFNINGSAITVGKDGHIFILKNQKILEYSSSGESIKHHPITNEIKVVRGYGAKIKIDLEGNLYVETAQKTYQIGRIAKEGTMKTVDEKTQLASEKRGSIGVIQDNLFQTEWRTKRKAVVKILNDNGEVLKEISMSTPDVFGAVLFLGQDEKLHIYVEVRRITTDGYTHLEVWKYDLEGNILSKIELPNDYYTSTVFKQIEIDKSGNIYQMFTTPEGVQIIKWEERES
jgi:hypothetical protein